VYDGGHRDCECPGQLAGWEGRVFGSVDFVGLLSVLPFELEGADGAADSLDGPVSVPERDSAGVVDDGDGDGDSVPSDVVVRFELRLSVL